MHKMAEIPGNASAPGTSTRRRYLSILFADLSDSTRLAATMEAEHYAEILNALRQASRQVIPRHGGRIAQLLGDGVLAIFGYPDAREDDGRRATEAALELHDAVRRLRIEGHGEAPISLGLHTGIHAGLVLAGEGDLELGRFELLGNAPNIAARLADVAERDEILVSEETLGPHSHFFRTGELRHLSLKGTAEPMAVYPVLSRAPIHTRFEASVHRGLAPFVGRQSEIRMLEQSLSETLSGKFRYAAICAPAGLGKTRLAEEFLHRATDFDCQIHRGYCESYLSAEPLQPFLQMLRSLFGMDHGNSPSLAAASVATRLPLIDPALCAHQSELLRVLSLGDDTKRPAAENTIAALSALFDRLAANQPMVLFIDDWQWADDATRQVFRAIRCLEGRALFLLISTRGLASADVDMSAAQIIELAPFTRDEAAETIDRFLPGTDPFVAAEIHRYSGGNPLFIEELCHCAVHEDIDRRLNRVHGGAAWLDSLIESRVARLPEAQAELVRAAAVIGNVIPSWLLENITGYAQDHPLVQGLAQQDFIFPGEKARTLRFKHGIARDVIYGAVGLHKRKAMHLRIAESLRQQSAAEGQEEAYESLAYHYGAGGQATQAAYYAELAGDKAVAASALDRAKAQYRAALAALDGLVPSKELYQRWISIAHRLGLACVFDASRDELKVFRRAVELAEASGDLATMARAEYWLGYISYALGDSRPALYHCERALRVARRAGDDPLAVQIRATLGQVRAAVCDYDLSLELLDEAILIKRRHRTGARPAVGFAYSLACKAQILGDRGLFAPAHECFDEALESVRGANHEVEASIRGWRSAVLLWQGRWEDARQSAVEAYRIGEQVRSLFSFSMSHAAGAYASWMLERTAASLQAIQNATSWLEPRDVGLFRSLNFGWLADAMVTSGRIPEARHFAARALLRARHRDLIGVAMAYRALARAAASLHDRRRAQHYLALAMRTARTRQSAHEVAVTQLCDAELELTLDDRARARRLLDEAMPAFEEMGMRWHFDEALRLYRSA